MTSSELVDAGPPTPTPPAPTRAAPTAAAPGPPGPAPLPLPLPVAAPAAVGAGLLAYLAFPGHDLWFLAPVAAAALVLVVTGQRLRRAARSPADVRLSCCT